ncbi:S-layer homology domain-containing protein [Paenibacillus sp. JDR-2]|uniref:S-layer homology domain-containing protein n=1 Tax=Paenibacillus sp. (strain JDR-2) TaxID=324057 RepID=UPI00059EE842|nr:S-layer homology domain-containing protein [Paenibacillus sp. JDR-2]
MLTVFFMLFGMVPPSLAAAANNSNGGSQPEKSDRPVFSDIQSHWAYNEITELAEANIVAGFTDGTFRPSGQVTREQFLKMLVVLNKYSSDNVSVPFKDIEPTRWSEPYIAAGLKHGILLLTDYPDGKFKPSQPITRFEMAIWIVRALQLPPGKDERMLSKLKDQANIKQSRSLIEAALETGIIRGMPDGSFQGGIHSTRAEAAVMLSRALNYLLGKSGAPHKIVQYRPEVKLSASKNYSMRDSSTWVITDPQLKLSAGDVFVMPPNDKYYGGIAKKVVSVSKENGTLIVKTSVPRLKEVFSKLDISTSELIDPKLLKPINSSVTIQTSGQSAQPMNMSLLNQVPQSYASLALPCFNIGLNNAKLDGIAFDASLNACNLGVNADIGLDVDFDWFDTDLEFYSKLVLTGDITTKVHASANTGNSALNEPKFIPLTTPFYVPVFTGVFVKGQLFLRIDPDFRASVVVDFNDQFHLEQGFSLSSSNGLRAINNTTNTATLNVDTKANASIAAGPDVQLTLTLLDVAYAGFDLYPGIEAGYSRNYEQGRCDAINVDAFLRLDVIAGYDIWIASDDFRANLINAKYQLYQTELNCPPPQPPGNLKAELFGFRATLGPYSSTIINRTDVQLSWSAVKDAATYNVKRSESSSGPFTSRRTSSTQFKDTTATIGKTYYYQITAVNEHGESKPSSTFKVAVTMQPPPAPQSLTADKRGGASVVLHWADVGGLVHYTVQRADGNGTNFATIASNVSGTSYTDSSASLIKAYSYRVMAEDNGGTSAPSNVVSVPIPDISVTPIDPVIPIGPIIIKLPAPANFNAGTDINSGKVILTWNAVSGAAGYDVMRSTAANGTFTVIGSKITEPKFTDTTASIGVTYYYKVAAVSSNGAEGNATAVKSAAPSSGIH